MHTTPKIIQDRIAEYEAKAESLYAGLGDLTPIARTMAIGEIDACYQAIEMLRTILRQIAEASE